ncbi:MAG: hypothetical protein JHD16_18000 [Solirubrobacteraceae bacterium]|nr:hypothetical protein [Solirubrobacteraceae bacterium]
MARQLRVDVAELDHYEWSGRSGRRQRAEARAFLGYLLTGRRLNRLDKEAPRHLTAHPLGITLSHAHLARQPARQTDLFIKTVHRIAASAERRVTTSPA